MTTPDIFLFVSHVSEDRSEATDIVAELERRGVRCWMAPRDVHPGKPFDDEIAEAIDASRAMLLIFSEHCNESEYIRREVTVAGEAGKVIIPFRIENVQPRKGLRVRLSDLHWIDGFVSRERAVDELVRTFTPDDIRRMSRQAGEEHRQPESETKDRAEEDKPRDKEEAVSSQKAEAKEHRPLQPPALPLVGRSSTRTGVIGSLIVAAIIGTIGVWFFIAPKNPAAVSRTSATPSVLLPEGEAPVTPKAISKTCANCPRQAENQVPVAIVQVISGPNFAEVHIQVQAAQISVCWSPTGPNSPYLLADGHRYRYRDGDNVTACPTRKLYAANEVMVLRFQPLGNQVDKFSFVEGEGGENQLVDHVDSAMRYWNFFGVALN
jgi:hypothetical protein